MIQDESRPPSAESLKRSKVFCAAPWTSVNLTNDGQVLPCCFMTPPPGSAPDLRQGDVADACNSILWRSLRRDMLAGKESSACSGCYEKERLDISSPRLGYRLDRPILDAVSKTRPDGILEKIQPLLIQLIFSNKCNFRCRTCDPWRSSAWVEEAKRLGADIRFWPSSDGPPIGGHQVDFQIYKSTDKPGGLWEQIEPFLQGLEEISIAGGEPLLEEENLVLLKRLIAKKKTDIMLFYNTNFSITQFAGDDVFRLWKRFKKVVIAASVDGSGRRGEYLRTGFRWAQLLRNRERLAAVCPDVEFVVQPTVSVMNVLHIPDFYRELLDHKVIGIDQVGTSMPLVRTPPEYSVQVLPPRLKRKVLEEYKSFALELVVKYGRRGAAKTEFFARTLPRFMMASDQQRLLPDFRERTALLDRSRGESFADVFPELAELVPAAADGGS